MNDNAEDCPVCLTIFDDTMRRPRNLPCGHTFCTDCIDGLKEQGEVTCPTCRASHIVPEVGQFPISYITEAFIKRLRDAALVFPPPKPVKDTAESPALPVTQPVQKRKAGLSRVANSLLQEQEAKALATIRTCQEVQTQLDQYCTTLTDLGNGQQQLEDRVQAILDQSKNARLLVHQEKSQVVAKKEELNEGEQQLHDVLQTMRTAETRDEAYKVIEDADLLIEEESQRMRECLGMFPDVHTITTITKVRETSQAALEAFSIVKTAQETVSDPAGATGDSGLQAASASSIMGRLKSLLGTSLKVEDLLSLTQNARDLLQAGLVFSVHQVEGHNQHGRISLEDDCLYVYSLQDQPLPPLAVTVQLEEVMDPCPPCKVFLDLEWPGSGPRRVVVHLSRDTNWGRQFLLLCTGQQGPCYVNTRLHMIVYEGLPKEYVVGGDYEYGDGSGGAALLPRLPITECWSSSKIGHVGVVKEWNDRARAAQFIITTRNHDDSGFSGFGNVVKGLEAVEEAACHRPITEVIVVQCGVEL